LDGRTGNNRARRIGHQTGNCSIADLAECHYDGKT
jgi:hypothetical protein